MVQNRGQGTAAGAWGPWRSDVQVAIGGAGLQSKSEVRGEGITVQITGWVAARAGAPWGGVSATSFVVKKSD